MKHSATGDISARTYVLWLKNGFRRASFINSTNCAFACSKYMSM